MKLSKQQLARLLQAKADQKSKATLLDLAFPRQRQFIDDPAKRKAALCTRKAGKTHGIVLLLLHAALSNPESVSLYCGLTRKQAQDIVFDRLKKVNAQRNLGGKFHNTELYVRFPNGSRIQLLGIDASPEEAQKVLGGTYHFVAVDEAASHRQDLQAFCDDLVGPALDEVDGTLCLIGTPGNVDGYFKAVTQGEVPGWEVHQWTFEENPYTRDALRKRIAQMKRATPGIEQTPGFRQMYLGEWVIDEDAKVYKFDPKRNEAESLPQGGRWQRVIGLDFGFVDDTAYVVMAWREGSTELYVEYAYKEKQTDYTLVAQRVHQLMEDYEPYAVVADFASRQGVEELRNRHGLPLERADKGGKVDMVRHMNSDLIVGRIKVLPQARMLSEEWQELVWDDVARKQGILKPHPSCPDHLADAARYAWKRCYNYATRPEDDGPEPGSPEWLEQREDEAAERRYASRGHDGWDVDDERDAFVD